MKGSEKVSCYELVEDAVAEVIRPLVEVEPGSQERLLGVWINCLAARVVRHRNLPSLILASKKQGLIKRIRVHLENSLVSFGIGDRLDDLSQLEPLLKDPRLADCLREEFRRAIAA